MSLVNDMLNDLERRRSERPTRTINLEWMGGGTSPRPRRSRRLLYIVAAVLTLTLIAAIAWRYQALQTPSPPAQTAAPQTQPASAPASALTGLSWSSDASVTRLYLTLSAPKSYAIRRENGGLSIRLYDVTNHLDAATLSPLSPVQSISIQQQGADVVVSLRITGDFEVSDRLVDEQGKKVELSIKAIAPPKSAPVRDKVATVATKPTMPVVAKPLAAVTETAEANTKETSTKEANTKEASPTASAKSVNKQLTLSQRDMQLVQKAKQLLREGDSYRAEKILEEFVSGQPQAIRSAKLLATLWLSQQRYGPAADLLATEIKRYPDDIELRTLQARLLLARGKTAAAVDWLMSVKPDIGRHENYYEVLGFAARQDRQYKLSEQVYRGLVAVDGSRGDWWVGLGIALDAQAKTAEARRAFQQALASGQISEPLQRYAQQRVSATN